MGDPRSFDITWRNGAYYVSVPNYKGGTVYTADVVAGLTHENEALKAVLLNPHPDQEPDNIRLHREKCDALDKATRLERENEALWKVMESIEYASRKDSLTERERLDSVRHVVLSALSIKESTR